MGTGLVVGTTIAVVGYNYSTGAVNPDAWLRTVGALAGALGGGIEASLSGGDFGDVMLGAGIGSVFGAICPTGAIGGLFGGGLAALGAYAAGGDPSTIATAYQWGSLAGGLAGDFTGGVLSAGKNVAMRAAIGKGLWNIGPDLAGAGVGAAIGYYEGDRTAASALHGANLGMMVGGITGGAARGLWGSRRVVASVSAKKIFHHTNSVDLIHDTGKVLGLTEGRVYGTRLGRIDTGFRRFRMGLRSTPSGRVEFIGNAAEMFRPHPFQGWYSGLKRLAGQQVSKKVGYDIVFDPGNAYRHGNILRISNADFVRQSAGRFAWSNARYYSRLGFIDWGIPVAAGAAFYYRQDITNFIEGYEEE